MMDLERVARLIPEYKSFLENVLSVQERKVVVGLVHCLKDDQLSFRNRDVNDQVRIQQHSHFSAIVTRLIDKGVLTRIKRGEYKFIDIDLVNHVKVRCLNIKE